MIKPAEGYILAKEKEKDTSIILPELGEEDRELVVIRGNKEYKKGDSLIVKDGVYPVKGEKGLFLVDITGIIGTR